MSEAADDRKWFTKKRVLIPGAIFVLAGIGSAAGGESVAAPDAPDAVALVDDIDEITATDEFDAVDASEPIATEEAEATAETVEVVDDGDGEVADGESVEAAGVVDEDVDELASVAALATSPSEPVEEEVVEFETYECNGAPLEVPVGEDGDELCNTLSSAAFIFTIRSEVPEVAERADLLDSWDDYATVGRAFCSDFNPGSSEEELGLAVLLSWTGLGADAQAAFNDDPEVFALFGGAAIGAFCPDLLPS